MGTTILENLIPLAVTVLTPVLLALVHYALRKLAKKWHLEDAIKYEDQVDAIIIKGIKAAEQKSLTALKSGGEKTPGEKKLDDVMKFVNGQLSALELDQKATDQLVNLIEARLYDDEDVKALSNGVATEEPAADPA